MFYMLRASSMDKNSKISPSQNVNHTISRTFLIVSITTLTVLRLAIELLDTNSRKKNHVKEVLIPICEKKTQHALIQNHEIIFAKVVVEFAKLK